MQTCSTLYIQQTFPEFTQLSGIVSMLGFLPTIIFIPFVGKLVNKFGKKESSTCPMLLGVVAGILLLVLVPGLGRTINGATRWINLPVFGSAQPSEITKLGLILFFAAYLSKHRDELKHIWKGFLKPIICFMAPPILILLLVIMLKEKLICLNLSIYLVLLNLFYLVVIEA